ncbi:protoporphyrin IX magnesium-chelatase [Roseovarius nanhaiticus]|uniref:Protoporphyrin IX magnesium-chelatase n=2 Tax=Roseovarius nanhaiticus TaxID=573024 RepID=A0A1N7HGN1_9RHOB|nr:protoporphyrin IX magnesium-chelatase [Roseovarius nanhaiticus]SIS23901.1 protoporphyrin IX magnesium-chelatase [Roseovarius nanhaiticus]
MLALRLLAVDPVGLGGITLRARSGPARDAFLAALKGYPRPARRLGPDIDDAALFGGLDLNATLAAGRMVRQAGLAAHDGPLILPMAERARPELAARLAAMMDSGTHAHPLIALDEAASEDEGAPSALTDRLAFALDLEGLSLADIAPLRSTLPGPLRLPRLGEDHIHRIAMLAEALGVPSPRAACLAMRAASAHAALEGRADVSDADIEIAATLVLAPRATCLPEMEEEAPPEVPEPPETPPESETEPEALPDQLPDQLPDDILIEAILARLPEDMLARIARGKARQAKGSGSGDKTTGKRRGRPLTPRKGRLGGAARLDLVATLRAAAPWQKARAAQRPDHAGLHIRPSDIHLRRYEERADRLLIFVVDASGSAAMTRLAEAKGAVELMLAAAYARRDHVALIGFRGTEAEVLLPPTRSLVRTKRELAALPGGGATPLAHGLRAAMELARAARAKGMTPTLALLTDGRANIALDGSPDRARAGEDAAEMGRAIAASGASALVVDMGARPETALETLASAMHAPYFVLPRADARRISEAVRSVMDG